MKIISRRIWMAGAAAGALGLAGPAAAEEDQQVAIPQGQTFVLFHGEEVRIPLKDDSGKVRAYMVYRTGFDKKISFTDGDGNPIGPVEGAGGGGMAAIAPLQPVDLGDRVAAVSGGAEADGKSDSGNSLKALQTQIDKLAAKLNDLIAKVNAARR